MIIPKGKKVYVKGQRFCEGEILPSHITEKFDIKFEDKKIKKIKKKEENKEFNFNS